ncbi:MAG: rod shape-determining protein MreC, partial [Flavobacteriales bacterium]|nr:rod shape-determining protein MreC [Flavobacteriales bacterium]
MRNLFRFIKVYHFALLFILIESFSLFLYISNHKFQQSKFLSFTQEYTGAIYSYYSDINEYFDLKKENNYLKQENAKLLSILSKEENNQNPELFNYISATIIKNSIYKEDNYLLLNKGEKDGVRSNMGVVTENGVIGIISTTSKNYSKAISILNQTSSISILHLKSKQNGSLIWTGNDYRTAEINDIPNHADLLVGDTIVTNGFSSIFPEGIK